jgi:hypothetical protein
MTDAEKRSSMKNGCFLLKWKLIWCMVHSTTTMLRENQ